MPGQSTRQHRQGIAQIDHGVNATAEKAGACIFKSPKNQLLKESVHIIYT